MKYHLIDATSSDGQKMLELIESTPSKGMLKLLYTRRPNPYDSYIKENKNSLLKLVKDKQGEILFQVIVVPESFYIEGKMTDIYYVGGLRKNQKFKKDIHWTDMFTKLNEVLPNHEFYCSVLNDNKHAKDVLLKKRGNWPNFYEMCTLHTNIFTPKVIIHKKWDCVDYHIEKVKKEDWKQVYEFLNKEGKKYNFFPVIQDLKRFYDLDLKDCYVLKKKNEIVGFTALWNQTNYKQYIVEDYGFPLNVLSKFSFITKKLGYISFPKVNQAFPFYYLSFFIVKDFDLTLYKTFLYKICKEVNGKIDSLVLGNTREEIQKNVFHSIKKISFDSTVYYIYYGEEKKLINDCFIECALL